MHFFVFSDDLKLAKTFVEELNIKFTLITHNVSEEKAYADLWLMTLCNNFIIANSTFSWWSSWLGNSKNVIAPRKWFSGDCIRHDTKDLYLPHWKIL